MANVLDTYRGILSHRGAPAFALAGLLSRLPISMFNISVILMIQIQYDRWEIAGRVAAVGVIVWALQTMPTARWVDRYGQKFMWPLTAMFVAGTTILIWTAMSTGPEALLWLGVAIASFSGPLGSLTRARWSHILDSDDEIHTAFSLEGSLDEVLFVGGPALATYLAYVVHPAAGLVVACFGMVVGITLLLAQKSSEPPPSKGTGVKPLGFAVPKAVLAVALTAVALGSLFGALDITTVAFAKANGFEAAGGVVLGIISLGSFFGGLAYGARKWKTPLWKRLLISGLLLAVGFVVLGQISNLWLFAAVGFFVGMTIAPAITSQDSVAQRVVAQSQLVEGMAWLRIGIGAGVALGAWVGGRLLDQYGYQAGLQVVVWSAVGFAVLALLGTPWIKRDTEAVARRRGVTEADMEDAPTPHDAGETYVEQPPTSPNI